MSAQPQGVAGRARLFYTNRSQAVRLPKSANFPENVTNLLVVPHKGRVTLIPAPKGWEDFFDNPAYRPTEDFLEAREQPSVPDDAGLWD